MKSTLSISSKLIVISLLLSIMICSTALSLQQHHQQRRQAHRQAQQERILRTTSFPAVELVDSDNGDKRQHSERQSNTCTLSHGLIKVSMTNSKPTYQFLSASCEQTPAPDTVAWGVFDDEIMKTGWGDLTIKTSSSHPDLVQAYAAGYLEGALTKERIWQMARVIAHSHHDSVEPFFKQQESYLRQKMAAVNPTSKDVENAYWHNIALVVTQLDGVLAGYNEHVPANQHITMFHLWLMNSDGDIMDIERIPRYASAQRRHKKASDMTQIELIELVSMHSHCSALIKWVPGRELYAAHTTWEDYIEMIRIYKHYHFNFNHPSVKAKLVSFSSYPGFISSSDDFYTLDTGLVAIETTINILDEKLYDYTDPTSQVLAWVRNIVANRMATTGKEWIDYFVKYNSGTYNDQWMIVDYKLFRPELQQLQPGTLWIVEQIPGYVESKDATSILNKDKYWASYNRPYFEEVNKRSMFQHYSSIHGEMFSYRDCPRARIFLRDHSTVNDINGMKRLMMQNKWQNDPLSKGCPGNAIAARFDIEAYNCPMSRVTNGATDAKITSSQLMKLKASAAISGPSHDDQPAFSWRDPLFVGEIHEGQPDVYNFSWQLMQPAQL